MPELPDLSAYITALESRIVGEPIEHVRLASPSLLRTVEPPLASVEGRTVRELQRIGKRKIQRTRYADHETNYCARCQTGGKVPADRGLSRLLGSDWPRTLDELEALKRR